MSIDYSKRFTRFGCELEICWNYGGAGCSLGIDKDTFDVSPFIQRFNLYYTHAIYGNPAFPLIRDLYGKFYVTDWKYYYEYDMTKAQTSYAKKITDPEFEFDYTYPIFTPDSSVQCGDTDEDHKANVNVEPPPQSFAVECVTPILTIDGEITEQKVGGYIAPFLIFFGLASEGCFVSNSSTGFHVNVSLVDESKGGNVENEDSFVDFKALPGFMKFFYKEYLPYENRMYSKVRHRLLPGKSYTGYAKPLRLAHNQLERKLAEQPNQDPDVAWNQFYSLEQKYRAAHLKDNGIMEFRLYSSEPDWKVLTDYTFQGLHLLNFIYDNYLLQEAKKHGGARRAHTQRRRVAKRRTLRRLRL